MTSRIRGEAKTISGTMQEYRNQGVFVNLIRPDSVEGCALKQIPFRSEPEVPSLTSSSEIDWFGTRAFMP
jgi:hypothetical protein